MILRTAVATGLAAALLFVWLLVASAQTTPLLAYIFVGQSNMTGVSAWPEWPAEPVVDSRIVMWSKDNRARGQGPEPAHQPVYYDLFQGQAAYPHQGGMSLSLPFAQRILERYPNVRVMLLTCVGTTYVGAMQPGQPGFETCVQMANEAQLRYGASVAGIVTYAGEADTGPDGTTPSTGTQWGPMYVNMVTGFRQRLGIPTLAAVDFELASFDPAKIPNTDTLSVNWTTVENQQHYVANQIPYAAVVDPDPWAVLFDGLHSDTATNTRNGREAADTMMRLDSLRFAQTPAPTPIPTVGSQITGCNPRPPVQIEQHAAGSGRLAVTIRPGAGILYGVVFQASSNVYPVTDLVVRSDVATFTLVRMAPGSTLLNLTVTDACGPWQTFVGGGAGSF